MALEISWRLPASGVGLTQAGAWIQLALALEYAGIEGLWIDQGIDHPESLAVAATLCAHTKKLAMTVSVAPEVMLPAALAATVQSLQSVSHQRTRLHLPDSGRNSAYRAFGEFLNRDQHSERISEYLDLLTRLLAPSTEPFSHCGRYFQLENAGFASRTLSPPPLVLDQSQGHTLCARHADACLMPLGPQRLLQPHMQNLRDMAHAQGRELTFCCHLNLIMAATENHAWQLAEQHLQATGIRHPESPVGVAAIDKAFATIKRLQIQPQLWQPVTGGPVFVVGTPAQVAARLASLHELGFSHVILASSLGVADVLRFAEQVLPALAARGFRKAEVHHV